MSMSTHSALDLNTADAVAWSAAHPDMWVFPGRMVPDGAGGWIKKPLVAWTKAATKDPETVRRLWDRVGGRAVVCVACDPSGIFVIDEDRDVEDPTWKSVLDMVRTARMTRVLKSATKGRPHYIFRQPTTGDPVAEGRWEAGDVKAAGIIFLANHDPIVDAPINPAPAGLLALLKRRPKGTRGRGIASYEALNDWLASTPDHLIIGEAAQDKFLEKTVDKMSKDIEDGEHRRTAALNAVYHAALEAASGCYPADKAFIALKDEYQSFRDGDSDPGKGWTPARESDYDAMWASLVPEFKAGDHDEKIEEIQNDVFERYQDDLEEDDDFDDLEDWFEKVINADVAAVERAERGPVATPPEGVDTPELLPEPEVSPEGEKSLTPSVSTPDVDTADSKTPLTTTKSLVTPGATKAITAPTGPYSYVDHPMREVQDIPLTLHEDAFWGIHGEFIEKVRPYTEASDAGLLAVSLACAGVHFAETAYAKAGNAPHGPNLFILGVGESSVARKTTALQAVKPVYFPPDGAPHTPMFMPRDFSGIASGERLIHIWECEEEEVVDPATGAIEIAQEWPEPRVLWVEGEAAVLFKRAHRDGATMTETVCALWDQTELQHYARTAQDTRVPPERYKCGLLGLTTLNLAQRNVTDVEVHAGLGNRMLWFYMPDTGVHRDMPRGGSIPTKMQDDYRAKLDLYRAVKVTSPVEFTPDAWDLWVEKYGQLKRTTTGNGMVDALLGRNAPQVLRLALNYHLCNGGSVAPVVGQPLGEPAPVIGIKALRAALAVWDYNRASVFKIFAGLSGDPDIDEVINHLKQGHGWAKFSDIKVMGRKASTIERGIKAKVLVEGRMHRGRGRDIKIVGVAELVKRDGLTYPHPKDKETLRWF